MTPSLAFNDLLAQENKRNLAAFFARLREQGSLVFVPDFGDMGGAWIVTNYNDAVALLQYPDQKRLLQHDPTLIASAVEELLRSTSPVSLSDERWAAEDISLYGQMIRKGELVYAALIAANTVVLVSMFASPRTAFQAK